MDLSPYVLLAAATVGKSVSKKAVDALARSSLNGISEALGRQFFGNTEIQHLKDELELKTKVLLMPVDACVKRVMTGSTVLQGAVDVALQALRQIEAFEQQVQEQEMATVRGERSTSSGGVMSAAQASAKLRRLIDQLDTLVPYLTVAITSAGLAAVDHSKHAALSPSRLLFASGALLSAAGKASTCVFQIRKAQLYSEVSSRTASGMQAVFPLCEVRVMAASMDAAGTGTAGSTVSDGAGDGAGAGAPAKQSCGSGMPQYRLHIEQSLDDGLYHDDDEVAGSLTLLIPSIAGLSWTTAHSLGLTTDPFSPVLALHMTANQATTSAASGTTPTPFGGAAGARAHARVYAIQCARGGGCASDQGSVNDEAAGSASDAESAASAGCADEGETGAAAAAVGGAADHESDPQLALGRLDYVLRLAMLEAQDHVPHSAIVGDDRLRLAFAEAAETHGAQASPGMAARSASQSMQTPTLRSQMSGTPTGAADVEGIARNLTKLGFDGAK